jgi:predicted RNA-binding protein YlxR (DUF448 family)
MADPSIPVRTCVGCRRRAPVTELLRVVVHDGGLTPDPRRRLPGRGASLHPTEECLQAAVRRRALPRALRSSTALDTGSLEAHIASGGSSSTSEIQSDRHQAGPTLESRTTSDEQPVKSPR